MEEQAGAGFWLSPQQAHLWLAGQQGGPYNSVAVIQLRGSIRAEEVRAALDRLSARQEVLRTVLKRIPGLKIPFQVILPQANVSWETGRPSDLEELLDHARNRQFDLEQGPSVHAVFVDPEAAQPFLVLTMPAVWSDSRSLQILAAEIEVMLSGQEAGLHEPALRYVQFAQWQRDLLESEEEGDAATGKEYWKKSAASAPPVPALPLETVSASDSSRLETVSFGLDASILHQLEAIADQQKASLSGVLLAAWQSLIWRLTGQAQFLIAVFSSGREYEELQQVPGLIGKSLPIAARFDGELRFSDVVRQAGSAVQEAASWQEYFAPEDSAATNMGLAFDFTELPVGILHQEVRCEASKLKLCAQRSSGNLKLAFHFDAARLSRATVEQWSRYFISMLNAAAADPQALVSRLPLLTAAERLALLADWNQTAADYPSQSCIHELFEAQAAATPDRPALRYEDHELTYRQWNESSNQLAHTLRAMGVGPDSLVGLCVDRSINMAVALMAILKAGGAYVPVSADHPKARLAQQLAGAAALVTESKFLNHMPAVVGVICMDRDGGQWSAQPRTNPERVTNPENLVYVIYTSGSTGTPKGVGVRHRNLVNYAYFITRRLELDRYPEGLNFATVSTLGADLGNTCIYPSLISGGCLHIINHETAGDSQRLREYTAKYPLDVLKIVPSHLAALLEGGGRGVLPRRYLVLGGEALTPQLVSKIVASGADCEIVNHYGPTETTVGSLTLRLKDYSWQTSGTQTIPIGRPIVNTRVYILDAQGEPVPSGVTGGLYIAGEGVTAGYLNQPDLTADRFLSDPFHGDGRRMYRTGDLARYLPDGNVEFLGRTDDQVKIRGFRIELGEIEAALCRYAGVKQAVVLAREDERGDKRLVAYVAGSWDALVADHLRAHVRNELPEYMVPAAIVVLPKLPLNSNGKIDRQALPAPGQAPAGKAYIAPRTATESAIAGVWEEVLRRDRIGVDDDFFDIGGHSLIATQIASRLRDRLGISVAVRLIFDHTTIAALASALDTIREEADDDSELEIPIGRRR